MIKKNPQYPILIAERSVAKKPLFIFLCAMLLGSLPCFSTTYYSRATGSWALTSTWSLSAGGGAAGTLPAAGDDVVITSGFTVTVSGTPTITNIRIDGGTLNFNFSFVATSLTVTGDFTMKNTSAINGNFPGGIINVTGDFFVSAGANATIQNIRLDITGTFNNAATVTLNTGNSATKTFGHFLNNGTWNNTLFDVTITINGNFENNGTFNNGTGKVTFTGATSNTVTGSAAATTFNAIEVNKGLSTPTSTLADQLADQNYILDVQSKITLGSGRLFLKAGTFKLSSASTLVPFSSLNFSIPTAARLWNNGGEMNSTTSFQDWKIAGTLQNSAGTINVGVGVNDIISPDEVSGTGTVVISGGDVKVAGRISNKSNKWNYTMSGGTLTLGTVGNTASGYDPFNMDNAACSFTMTGGRIIIVNANNGDLLSSGATITGTENLGFRNIATLGGGFTGGTLQIGSDATLAAKGKIRVETTNPIYNLEVLGANTIALIATHTGTTATTSLTITNDVTITSGVLDIGTNNQDLFVGGNWTNTSSALDPFFEDTEKVTFNGTSGTQTIASTGTSAVNGSAFYDLTINNTSPTVPQLTTSADVVVRNTLTLTRGKVNLSGNTLTLGTSSTANGTLAFPTFNPTAAVQPITWMYGGTFKRFFSTTILNEHITRGLFPLGSETDYHPFWLNYSAALTAGGAFSVTHTPSGSGSVAIPNYSDASCGLTIEGISNASWLLSSTLNASGNPFGISYGGFGFANFLATDLNASLATNTEGTCNGVTETAGIYFDVSRKNLSSSDINNMSWFIGTANLNTSPLPIELLSFEAYMVDTTVNINWSTATETNCDYFLVERSIDGLDWKTIDNVNGNGTSTKVHAYTTTDPTAPFGYSYYRLKEVDYNGQFQICPIKSVYKPTTNKEVYRYINALGQQIADLNNYTGLYFILYTDGSVDKRGRN